MMFLTSDTDGNDGFDSKDEVFQWWVCSGGGCWLLASVLGTWAKLMVLSLVLYWWVLLWWWLLACCFGGGCWVLGSGCGC